MVHLDFLVEVFAVGSVIAKGEFKPPMAFGLGMHLSLG